MPEIYIKTDMTEMPKGCLGCDYVSTGYADEVRCRETGEIVPSECDYERRPDWCPLVEVVSEEIDMKNDDYCPVCDHHHCICQKESLAYEECIDCDQDPSCCFNSGRCKLYADIRKD